MLRGSTHIEMDLSQGFSNSAKLDDIRMSGINHELILRKLRSFDCMNKTTKSPNQKTLAFQPKASTPLSQYPQWVSTQKNARASAAVVFAERGNGFFHRVM